MPPGDIPKRRAGFKPASTILALDIPPKHIHKLSLLDKDPSVGYLKSGRKNFYS